MTMTIDNEQLCKEIDALIDKIRADLPTWDKQMCKDALKILDRDPTKKFLLDDF